MPWCSYTSKTAIEFWDYLSQPTPPKDLREALTKFEQYANRPEVVGCPFLRIASEFPDTAHPFHRLAIEHQNKIVDYLAGLLKPLAIDKGGSGGDTWRHRWRLLHSNALWDFEGGFACSAAEAVLKSFQSAGAQRRR